VISPAISSDAGEQAAQHYRWAPAATAFATSRKSHAAVGDERHARFLERGGDVLIAVICGMPTPGNDARGADRPRRCRPDAVRPLIDEPLAPSEVAILPPITSANPALRLIHFQPVEHALRMPVRVSHDDHVDPASTSTATRSSVSSPTRPRPPTRSFPAGPWWRMDARSISGCPSP